MTLLGRTFTLTLWPFKWGWKKPQAEPVTVLTEQVPAVVEVFNDPAPPSAPAQAPVKKPRAFPNNLRPGTNLSKVLKEVEASTGPFTAEDMAQRTNLSKKTVTAHLANLHHAGRLVKTGIGRYCLPASVPATPAQAPIPAIEPILLPPVVSTLPALSTLPNPGSPPTTWASTEHLLSTILEDAQETASDLNLRFGENVIGQFLCESLTAIANIKRDANVRAVWTLLYNDQHSLSSRTRLIGLLLAFGNVSTLTSRSGTKPVITAKEHQALQEAIALRKELTRLERHVKVLTSLTGAAA